MVLGVGEWGEGGLRRVWGRRQTTQASGAAGRVLSADGMHAIDAAGRRSKYLAAQMSRTGDGWALNTHEKICQ